MCVQWIVDRNNMPSIIDPILRSCLLFNSGGKSNCIFKIFQLSFMYTTGFKLT